MKIFETLAQERKKGKVSQEILAKRLGVSQQAVSGWEKGKRKIPLPRLEEIARILNLKIEIKKKSRRQRAI